MARNNRIFYACKAVVIMRTGQPAADVGYVYGLQSVGMSSNFTLDQVFEIGQLEIYENIEDVADVEVTLEKVIDGEKLIYNLASNGECRNSIVAASKERSDVYLAIYDDGQDNATGLARNVCWNSGMYVSSVGYNYSVDGSATESVTLVGNEKFWNDDVFLDGGSNTSAYEQFNSTGRNPGFDNDTPNSGVQRRVNVDTTSSTFPDIVKSQVGDDIAGTNSFHIQSISISADFAQENILELGRFAPYARYATFPIEVTAEFEVIATSGDLKTVSGTGPNLSNSTILIKDDAGTVLDLSNKNKLSSISYSGGDTGGGNATITYSFSNFNGLTVVDGGGSEHVITP
tara:strand:- start:3100 stop:4131 length:1032 start_codon:yes stop_codon:yes gene_type:complete